MLAQGSPQQQWRALGLGSMNASVWWVPHIQGLSSQFSCEQGTPRSLPSCPSSGLEASGSEEQVKEQGNSREGVKGAFKDPGFWWVTFWRRSQTVWRKVI